MRYGMRLRKSANGKACQLQGDEAPRAGRLFLLAHVRLFGNGLRLRADVWLLFSPFWPSERRNVFDHRLKHYAPLLLA